LRITVLGGTGYAGSHIVTEAAVRGHEVTSVSRTLPEPQQDGVEYVVGDARIAADRKAALEKSDVIIAALAPRGDMVDAMRDSISALASEAATAGVRVGVVGGAGTLLTHPGGPRVVDTPTFPAHVKPESLIQGGILDDLRGTPDTVDWFYISPAGAFGAFNPGERLGRYRTGDDVLLVDENGASNISGHDFGKAVIDEVETPTHHRRRFTVAY
jgi:putative NADH-flavin reductase